MGNTTVTGGESGERTGDGIEAHIGSDIVITYDGDESGTMRGGAINVTF